MKLMIGFILGFGVAIFFINTGVDKFENVSLKTRNQVRRCLKLVNAYEKRFRHCVEISTNRRKKNVRLSYKQ